MNVVIAGAGQVGRHVAEVLSEGGHNIVVMDVDSRALRQVGEDLDAMTLSGSAADSAALIEAGVESAGLFVAATNLDEINLLSASVAKALGAAAVVARVHKSIYHDQEALDFGEHLGIDRLICPERLTAYAILTVLRNPGALAIESFARGKIEMQQIEVNPPAEALGIPLAELRIASRVGTVQRGDDLIIPWAETVLEPGDVITLLADRQTLRKEKGLFQADESSRRHIVVMGATDIGLRLARMLARRAFSVRLIDHDEDRCQVASEELPEVTVINGQAADAQLLAEERIAEADAFVATGPDDEQNILTAVQVKHLGPAQTIVVVQRPRYMQLIQRIGIDRVFSPRFVAAREISTMVIEGPVRSVAALGDGRADIVEIVPSPGCRAIGKTLRELSLPRGCLVAGIQRGESVKLPGPDDRIEQGDVLVAIAAVGVRKQLAAMFR